MEGEEEEAHDQGDLEQEACEDIEWVPATEMTALVKAMNFFQPRGRAAKKVAKSREVVRKNGSGSSGEELREGVVAKKWRSEEHGEQAKGQNLVGDRHGEDPL